MSIVSKAIALNTKMVHQTEYYILIEHYLLPVQIGHVSPQSNALLQGLPQAVNLFVAGGGIIMRLIIRKLGW